MQFQQIPRPIDRVRRRVGRVAHRHGDGVLPVAEPLPHVRERDTGADQVDGAEVTQIVRPEVRVTRRLRSRLEQLGGRPRTDVISSINPN